MKEFAVAMIGLLVCLQQSTAQEKEKATESKFESIAAKNAVNKFQDRLALLDAKLMEQVELARGELKTDLEKALDLANEAKDFPEIQRIASYLESNADPGKRPETEPSKSTNVSSLQKQFRILQTELANGFNTLHHFGHLPKFVRLAISEPKAPAFPTVEELC